MPTPEQLEQASSMLDRLNVPFQQYTTPFSKPAPVFHPQTGDRVYPDDLSYDKLRER